MKNAVPPTAAAARIPTTITAAMITETHVLRLLLIENPECRTDGPVGWVGKGSRKARAWPIGPPLSVLPNPPYGPIGPTHPSVLLHQTTRFFRSSRIVVTFAERDGLLQIGSRRRLVAAIDRDASELEVGTGVHPLASRHGQCLPQIRFRLFRPAVPRARGPSLVVPERVLAEHAWARVAGKPREPFVEESLGLRVAAAAQRRRSALEPREAVARIQLAQHRELRERVGVPLLAVVEQDQREARV